jgi:hypothetical protein
LTVKEKQKMKRALYITGIVVLIGILAVSFVFIKMYNKPHTNVMEATPDYVVSAAELISEFESDEQQANEKYLDNIIQVEGIITNISITNGNSMITLSTSGAMGMVVCTMEPSQNKKVLGIDKGATVTIKGICTGYLMDVMLVRAVIVN